MDDFADWRAADSSGARPRPELLIAACLESAQARLAALMAFPALPSSLAVQAALMAQLREVFAEVEALLTLAELLGLLELDAVVSTGCS
jgi:hypothetical protein